MLLRKISAGVGAIAIFIAGQALAQAQPSPAVPRAGNTLSSRGADHVQLDWGFASGVLLLAIGSVAALVLRGAESDVLLRETLPGEEPDPAQVVHANGQDYWIVARGRLHKPQ